MEFIFVVVLALLLFGIPELLRSKRTKYEYPEIPDPEQEMQRMPPHYEVRRVRDLYKEADGEGISLEWEGQTGKGDSLAPAAADASVHAVEKTNPWSGHLNLPSIVNGVIFAEILQPPRAKRPLPCWWRR